MSSISGPTKAAQLQAAFFEKTWQSDTQVKARLVELANNMTGGDLPSDTMERTLFISAISTLTGKAIADVKVQLGIQAAAASIPTGPASISTSVVSKK